MLTEFCDHLLKFVLHLVIEETHVHVVLVLPVVVKGPFCPSVDMSLGGSFVFTLIIFAERHVPAILVPTSQAWWHRILGV